MLERQTYRNDDYKIKRLCEEKRSFDAAIHANSNLFGLLRRFSNKTHRKDLKCRKFPLPLTVHRLPSPAFTLAEVLITLGIIGIVAAMTIPTLMNNVQESQYKVAYKKAFSTAQQAYNNANRENLMVPNVSGDYAGYNANFLTFMDQFKITKKCINNDGDKCWDSTGEKYAAGGPWGSSYAFVDSSGVAYTTYYAPFNNSERDFMIDTNGFKKPNQYGKDRFVFQVFSQKPVSGSLGIPIKVVPLPDNSVRACNGTNKCVVEQNYFGTSWLYK